MLTSMTTDHRWATTRTHTHTISHLSWVSSVARDNSVDSVQYAMEKETRRQVLQFKPRRKNGRWWQCRFRSASSRSHAHRCADDGPFQRRFLLQELIFAHCEFLPKNLMESTDWCATRERGRTLRVCLVAHSGNSRPLMNECGRVHPLPLHARAGRKLCQGRQ